LTPYFFKNVIFSTTSINKTDRHNITDILLKVALNTINLTKPKSNAKIVETGKIDTLKRQRHAGSLFLVGTATSINSGGIK
jgi:hypothetical protein